MNSRICLLAAVLVALIHIRFTTSKEVIMDRMVFLNATYLEGYYNLTMFRVAKYNHTAYSINIEGETFKDGGCEVSGEATFYYNRLNNNQYTKTIIRMPKSNICNQLELYYPMVMESLKNYSNLPQYKPPAKLCPIKKGKYWVRNYTQPFDASRVPPLFTRGHWKLEGTIYNYDKPIASAQAYFRIQ